MSRCRPLSGPDPRTRLRVLAPAALSPGALATARSWLDATELSRCDSLGSGQARRNFTVGHALARVVVAEQCAVEPAQVRLVQKCVTCGGPHGRPQVPDLPVHVSIAHTSQVVAAVARRGGRIAVDCEQWPVRTQHEDALARLVPGAERDAGGRAALTGWTIHECLVKLGQRDLDDQRPVHRSADPRHPDSVLVEGSCFRSVWLPTAVVTVGSPDPVVLSFSTLVPAPLLHRGRPAAR